MVPLLAVDIHRGYLIALRGEAMECILPHSNHDDAMESSSGLRDHRRVRRLLTTTTGVRLSVKSKNVL